MRHRWVKRELGNFTCGGLATKPDKIFSKKECLHTSQTKVGKFRAMVEECMNCRRYWSPGFQ